MIVHVMDEFPALSRLSVGDRDALNLTQIEQLKQMERLTMKVQTLSSRVR